jgi:aminoglycoside/choline kinase family phosphotransferase
MTLDALHRFAQAALGRSLSPGEPMAGGGSDRRYVRFRDGAGSWVGVIAGNPAETRAFLSFTRHFAAQGIPVPGILSEDAAQGFYLLQDLGPDTLSDRLRAWRSEPDGAAQALAALRTVVRWLPVIQVRGGRGLDFSLCPGGPELGAAAFQDDLTLFLTRYVPRFAPAAAPSPAVVSDLAQLVGRLDAVPREHFCFRDFQARNVMWFQDGPLFLDYQSGRRGPLPYDLVSLLYSPDSGLAEPERQTLVADYLAALAGQGVRLERAAFTRDFHAFVLVRRLQALGAYARIAVEAGKPEYLDKIPPTLATLRELLEGGRFAFGLDSLEVWLGEVLGAGAAR